MTPVLSTQQSVNLVGEHPDLFEVAAASVEFLSSLRLSAVDDIYRSRWADFELRARGLSEHLSTALQGCRNGLFSASFAAVRVAMEHQVLDRLLLRGTRYEQILNDVDDETFEQWESDTSSWGEGVVSLSRTKRSVVVVRAGHNVVDSDGNVVDQISPYLALLEGHQPTLGPPSAQQEFFDGIGNLDAREQYAKLNRDIYRRFLKWTSMLHNLEVNDLVPAGQRVRLEVHYRFLSAFSHASTYGYELVRRNIGRLSELNPGRHCLSELVLLYVATFASGEIRTICEYTDDRESTVALRDRDLASAIMAAADEATSHLWYVDQMPTPYDFWSHANREAWRSRGDSGSIPTPPLPPDSYGAHEVSYYTDPLDRLHRLHIGGAEMTTGFAHDPMW